MPETVLIRGSSSLLETFQPLTPTQERLDGLLGHFVSQASDWKTLTALTVGELAYRWGKIGMISLAQGHVTAMPLRILSLFGGLGSEVTTFEFTNRTLQTFRAHGRAPLQTMNPNLWSWSGPGGWKEGLLTSLVTFGTLKAFGPFTQGQNIFLQHGIQDLGMVGGQQLISLAGLGEKPEGTFADQMLHAEVTNIQIGAGMALGHALTGGRVFAWERGLDLSIRKMNRGMGPRAHPKLEGTQGELPLQVGPRLALVSVGIDDGRTPTKVEPDSKIQIMQMVKRGEGGTKPQEQRSAKEKAVLKEQLEKVYGKDLLKVLESPILVEETLQAALEIPQRLEKGPKNLLTGLIHLQEKDSNKIHLTALGIKEIFNRNALYTSRGSYQDAVVQLFLESALSDLDPGQRTFALRYLHQALKKGALIRDLEDHLEQFGYATEYGIETSAMEQFQEEMSQLKPSPEKLALYPKSLLSQAFDYAMRSRVPLLVVKRIAAVVMAGDLPEKLMEFHRSPPNDRGAEIYRLLKSVPLEVVAQKIKGTQHTAYLDDLNLARKVASIRRTEYQWRVLAPNKIHESREILESAITDILKSMRSAGLTLKPERWIELLQCNSRHLSQSEDVSRPIAQDFEDKKFEIVIVSKSQFMADPAFDPRRSPFSLTRGSSSKSRKSIPQIVIRELPELDLESEKGIWDAFSAINSRLSALVFEWTMLKYSSSPPLAAQMIAHLETQRWRLMNGLPMEWELADRFGGMVQYLRGWVEGP